MSLPYDRAILIDSLRRATEELATSPPTVAEAVAMRAKIVDLLEMLGDRPTISRSDDDGSAPVSRRWTTEEGEKPSSLRRVAI